MESYDELDEGVGEMRTLAEAADVIAGLVSTLAQERVLLEDAKSRQRAMKEVLEESQEWATASMDRERAEARFEDARFELQDLACRVYGLTGDKKVHPAVGIREKKVVEYDEVDVFEWAKANALMFLKLDTKAFEAWAVKKPAGLPPGVSVELETNITVARNLTPFLPKKTKEAEVEEEEEVTVPEVGSGDPF